MRQSSHWGIASNHSSNCIRESNWAESQSRFLFLDKKGDLGAQWHPGEPLRLLDSKRLHGGSGEMAAVPLCTEKEKLSMYRNIMVNSGSPTSAGISFVPSASLFFLAFYSNLCEDLCFTPWHLGVLGWENTQNIFGKPRLEQLSPLPICLLTPLWKHHSLRKQNLPLQKSCWFSMAISLFMHMSSLFKCRIPEWGTKAS